MSHELLVLGFVFGLVDAIHYALPVSQPDIATMLVIAHTFVVFAVSTDKGDFGAAWGDTEPFGKLATVLAVRHRNAVVLISHLYYHFLPSTITM